MTSHDVHSLHCTESIECSTVDVRTTTIAGPHVEIKFKCMTGIEAGLLYCWDFYEFIKRCSIIPV